MRCYPALWREISSAAGPELESTPLLSSLSDCFSVCVCVCVRVRGAMGGIYERGYKPLLLWVFDHCLICLWWAASVLLWCTRSGTGQKLHVRQHIYPFTTTNVCVGVRAVVLMIGRCLLSQQARPRLHNPSAHFSSPFLPSSRSLFLLGLFTPSDHPVSSSLTQYHHSASTLSLLRLLFYLYLYIDTPIFSHTCVHNSPVYSVQLCGS